MPSEVDAYASYGTYSIRKKRMKSKLYYSSKKALKKSKMRTANNEFKFRRPSNCLTLETSMLLMLQV
jgi:hypothetical protein